MKKILSIFIIVLTINLNPIIGCSCGWNGGLVKNAQRNTLTIHGKVSKLKTFKEIYEDTVSTSIEVEIITKFKGEENRKFITVWGDRGADCRPYLSGIQIGSEWVFSLHQIKNNEYAISICGENITPVKENKTWGYILYNDRCSIEKSIIISVDSLQLAINNPSKFIFPTKSCEEGESNYFIEANQLPRIKEDKAIIQFLKEELNIRKDIREKYEDRITIEVFVDRKGEVEKIGYSKNWLNSKKMKRKYGRKITKLLKESSPWIPARHQGKNIPMKLILEIKIEELIKK